MKSVEGSLLDRRVEWQAEARTLGRRFVEEGKAHDLVAMIQDVRLARIARRAGISGVAMALFIEDSIKEQG